MATATFDEKKMKLLLKSAFAEAIQEQRALVQEIVEDAIEDIALAHAINQGMQSKPARRDSVYKILEGK